MPALVLAAARLAPLPVDGRVAGIPNLCVFHAVTGLPCPGCGMTRSLICLMHGRFHESFLYHPLGPFFAAALGIWMAIAMVRATRSLRRDAAPCGECAPSLPPAYARLQTAAAFVCLAAVVGVWVARLAHMFPWP
ncbi:MAG: DUF2752 domain-containing protein [Capsulimonadaceae bacterium]|nr:DUF2752 domain-containing protein [Capsulimonadaceae bacterium]